MTIMEELQRVGIHHAHDSSANLIISTFVLWTLGIPMKTPSNGRHRGSIPLNLDAMVLNKGQRAELWPNEILSYVTHVHKDAP